jgi:RNA 3'-phosphate cyclase
LAPQHVAAVGAVGAVCDATIDGLAPRSTALTFAPQRLRGGEFRVDVGTAGSVTLVLQALLPVLVAAGAPATVVVRGGTDVRAAPPLDYFCAVMLPLLARLGVGARVDVRRRGYYPRGGGEIALRVEPSRLRPIALVEQGPVRRASGVAHVCDLDIDIARRMRAAVVSSLIGIRGVTPAIELAALPPEQGSGPGGAIVAWVDTAHTTLGAGRVAERGVRAETLGAAVGAELAADLASGATLDVHAADQLLVYLALAGGGAFSCRELSRHAQTAIWLIEQFLPVRFDAEVAGPLVRVRVLPRHDRR